MSILDFISDVVDFEKSALKDNISKIKEDPERIFIGAGDPISSKAWGGVLGKKYEPLVDQWGGASADSYDKAEARGINTGPGRTMHDAARTVASMYAGNYATGKGAEALGMEGSTGTDWKDWVQKGAEQLQGALPQPQSTEVPQQSGRKEMLMQRAAQLRSRIAELKAGQQQPVKLADGGSPVGPYTAALMEELARNDAL